MLPVKGLKHPLFSDMEFIMGKAAKRQTAFFDSVAFGEKLRAFRTRAGFSSASKLSSAILSTTGCSIHEDTLKKLERGEGSPSFDRILAILFTIEKGMREQGLYTSINALMDRLLDACVTGRVALDSIEEAARDPLDIARNFTTSTPITVEDTEVAEWVAARLGELNAKVERLHLVNDEDIERAQRIAMSTDEAAQFVASYLEMVEKKLNANSVFFDE